MATDRELRRNAVLLGADYALFVIGLSFASPSTILPAFAAHLGATNVTIGAIPALMTLGWFLPPLFAAHHTRGLPRKMPFVLRYTALERVPFVVMAILAFSATEWTPALALAALLSMLLLITGTGGVLMPAWMDVIARVIPERMRGRFFGVSNSAAGVGGFVGSFGSAFVLATVAAPTSYGVCFLAAAAMMGLSWIALAMVREPVSPVTSERMPLRGFVALVTRILLSDRNLVWFLAARACTGVASMSSSFFTVYALRALGAADWQVGVFTSALLAGQVGANAVFGWMADRAGHRSVLMIGTAAAAGANAVAFVTASLPMYAVAFVLSGVNQAAYSVSGGTMLLDFARDPGERPTYVGLGNTALAPIYCSAPLLAGVMADRFGLPTVFSVALGAGLVGVILFALRVRDTRAIAPSAGVR